MSLPLIGPRTTFPAVLCCDVPHFSGHVDLCLAAYDWFLGHCETPLIARFYDAAMYACASHFSRVDKAKSILDDCLAIDIKPSVLTYNMLITTCSHSGQWEEAFGFFERCKRCYAFFPLRLPSSSFPFLQPRGAPTGWGMAL